MTYFEFIHNEVKKEKRNLKENNVIFTQTMYQITFHIPLLSIVFISETVDTHSLIFAVLIQIPNLYIVSFQAPHFCFVQQNEATWSRD